MAPCLPLLTADGREVRTLAGERPAVVKGPYDLLIILLDVVEEHRKIYITVVKVVNVDKIRIELLDLAEEVPCRDLRITSVVAGLAVKLLMDVVRDLVSYIDAVFVLVLIAARVKAADHFVTFLCRKICNLKHYVTCASEIDLIDLKDFHLRSTLPHI